MVYIGSKRKFLKELIPIFNKYRGDRVFVEPFAGGFNVTSAMTGKRIAADNHRYLIALMKKIVAGWVPPDAMPLQEYNHIRKHPEQYADHLVGFVGFNSFGSKWMQTYPNSSGGLNAFGQRQKHLLKQVPLLKDVDIHCCDYQDLVIPPHSFIYCDPPYVNTVVPYTKNFDNAEFWVWVRRQNMKKHIVLVSEYNAPSDFTCIWQKDTAVGINHKRDKRSIQTERLFVMTGYEK